MRRHDRSFSLAAYGRAFLFSSLSLALAACSPGAAGDAGVPGDAGDDDDAGVADGGSDPGDDAGTDAGADPCADADAVLGTLTLGAGFSVVESAPLPAEIVVVEAVPDGDGHRLFGLDVVTSSVVELGAWPLAAGEATTVFGVIPPDLEDDGAFPSWFLAHDGVRIAAGYTGTFDAEALVAPGAVALYDTTAGVAEPLSWIDSDNNFAADFVGDALVVNASSVDALAEGTGVYALVDGAPTVFAEYADPATTYGGPVLSLGDGRVVVAGYFGDPAAQRFLLLSADEVATGLGEGSVALADVEEVAAAPSLAAARFGADLAYLHGDFFNPFEAVRRVSVADGAARTPVDVLTFHDECTEVDLLADLGDDLLVGVTDDAGRRLVRIREDG